MADNKNHTLISFILVGLFLVLPYSAYAQVIIGPDICLTFPTSPECLAKRDAVIVVPGIVGSFNLLALFGDKEGGIWGPVPFHKIYQGLVMRLEAEKYVRNKDLFVAYYDWRQNNAESATEFLAPIIQEAKKKTGKVDIIAHSMGGLLVQQYITSDKYTPGEIDRFVMLGTPNEGSSAAYLPWEGGVFPTTWSVPIRFYMDNIHNALRKKRGVEDVAPKSYRQIFPSLKELLPIGTFVKKDGTETLSGERNTFLEALKAARANLPAVGVTTTTIAGIDNTTLGTVEVASERTAEDETLERWRDGHPIEEVPAPNNAEGDKTVLKTSALFGTRQVVVGNIPHNALPEYAQNDALKAIGVQSSRPKIFTYTEPKWLTGFVVLSPVDITITDVNGKVVSKDQNDFGDNAYISMQDESVGAEGEEVPKLIILKDLPLGTYTVHLTGTGTGEYTVIITHTDEETTTSKTFTGTTTLGKEESFTVEIAEEGARVTDIVDNSGGFTLSERSESKGDEKDCCPGHDPSTGSGQVLQKKGKVLGATTKKVAKLKRRNVPIEKLQPLNQMFFEVYGRMPTYEEWKYWADRYLTDKGKWESLKNTMLYYKGKGYYTGI